MADSHNNKKINLMLAQGCRKEDFDRENISIANLLDAGADPRILKKRGYTKDDIINRRVIKIQPKRTELKIPSPAVSAPPKRNPETDKPEPITRKSLYLKFLKYWSCSGLDFIQLDASGTIEQPFPTIYYVDHYYPWQEVKPLPTWDERRKQSSRILNLKDRDTSVEMSYTSTVKKVIERSFDRGIHMCVMPSHEKGGRTENIWDILNYCNLPKGYVLDDVLYRTRDNGKKTGTKGQRLPEPDYNSITVKPIERNTTYLIIDDVVTSGSSMIAAARLLMEAGAEKVFCLGIAKTIHIPDNSE